MNAAANHPIERICPKCGAEAGQPCVSTRGRARKSFHRERGSRRSGYAIVPATELRDESPIERLLLDTMASWIDHSGFNDVSIASQVPIGPYRADILVTEGERKLVVECDGAAFHSNAEQVAHDRRRDRYCAVEGYAVMRFSGEEINRDPRGCAAQIGAWIVR